MHEKQKQLLKDLIIEPIFLTLAEHYKSEIETRIWEALRNDALHALIIVKSTVDIEVKLSWHNLQKLHAGDIDLRSTFGEQTPSLDELRLAIYESLIDLLHTYDPLREDDKPRLNPTNHLNGMEKIRAIFVEYMTKTQSGSIERYKLGHEIVMEKRKLGLDTYPAETNIYETGLGYVAGDFKNLDLSNLNVIRDDKYGHGNFYSQQFQNSNLDGSNFTGVHLYGADFSGASLRGVDFSKNPKTSIVTINADIEGALFFEGYTPDERARNFSSTSQDQNELLEYRKAYFPEQYIGFSNLTAEDCGAETISEDFSSTESSHDSTAAIATRVNSPVFTPATYVDEPTKHELQAEIMRLREENDELRRQLQQQANQRAGSCYSK